MEHFNLLDRTKSIRSTCNITDKNDMEINVNISVKCVQITLHLHVKI